jgi:hypothetical protein
MDWDNMLLKKPNNPRPLGLSHLHDHRDDQRHDLSVGAMFAL